MGIISKKTAQAGHDRYELVGGPLCGILAKVPKGIHQFGMPYHSGTACYEVEDGKTGKALWIGG